LTLMIQEKKNRAIKPIRLIQEDRGYEPVKEGLKDLEKELVSLYK